jgi:hypothetical protein
LQTCKELVRYNQNIVTLKIATEMFAEPWTTLTFYNACTQKPTFHNSTECLEDFLVELFICSLFNDGLLFLSFKINFNIMIAFMLMSSEWYLHFWFSDHI